MADETNQCVSHRDVTITSSGNNVQIGEKNILNNYTGSTESINEIKDIVSETENRIIKIMNRQHEDLLRVMHKMEARLSNIEFQSNVSLQGRVSPIGINKSNNRRSLNEQRLSLDNDNNHQPLTKEVSQILAQSKLTCSSEDLSNQLTCSSEDLSNQLTNSTQLSSSSRTSTYIDLYSACNDMYTSNPRKPLESRDYQRLSYYYLTAECMETSEYYIELQDSNKSKHQSRIKRKTKKFLSRIKKRFSFRRNRFQPSLVNNPPSLETSDDDIYEDIEIYDNCYSTPVQSTVSKDVRNPVETENLDVEYANDGEKLSLATGETLSATGETLSATVNDIKHKCQPEVCKIEDSGFASATPI